MKIFESNIPTFNTYQDAIDYVASKKKTYGQDYLTTDEYKELYPIIKKLYDIEKSKFVNKKQHDLNNIGAKVGDKILISWQTAFGGSDQIEGTLIMRSGIPYVKLPHKMPVSKSGRIIYKQSVPFNSKTMKVIK